MSIFYYFTLGWVQKCIMKRKSNRLKGWVRLLLVACGLGLLTVLIVPIWRIELSAPQYPEGLKLQIYANKLGGDVQIINGLNHYIGMKTLHTNDFPEFTVLPFIIVFFAFLFLLVAWLSKRNLLYILFLSFLSFGAIAMIDFWRWDYNYGHNLNPNAAIIVSGMAYQPPLIGYKQLLNFGAYSIPDTGGWIFIGGGLVLFLCTIVVWRKNKKYKSTKSFSEKHIVTVMFLIAIGIAACNAHPQPLKSGTDNCSFCKMTVSDPRFGAEIITKKGKIYKFDDIHCLLSYLRSNSIGQKEIKDIYLVDFSGKHALAKSTETVLLKSDDLHSPMGGNVAAFTNADSLHLAMQQFKGIETAWKNYTITN